jgi:hypothetical protein
MNWFDILKEPLISVPKSIVSMKKPKKVETKEDCKERLRAFIEKVKSLVPGSYTKDNYVNDGAVGESGMDRFNEIPEEVACKAIELLRKEANNKDYEDGGVSYRGRFPKLREKHGNLKRMDEIDDWEISVLLAKFDMGDRSRNKGALFFEFRRNLESVYAINVNFDTEIPELDNYDKVKAVIP